MKKSLRTLPLTCGARLSRRSAVRQVGGWAIYLGVATVAACGRTPLGDPLGDFIGDDDDDDAATTLTPTPTATETPIPCSCTPVSGSGTGLNMSDIPVNSFAVNAGAGIFICHDAAGFFAMSDRCIHNERMASNGSTYSTSNLGGGFRCSHQNSQFNGNGEGIGGPAGNAEPPYNLQHYLLTIDPSGELFLDQAILVDRFCRCMP